MAEQVRAGATRTGSTRTGWTGSGPVGGWSEGPDRFADLPHGVRVCYRVHGPDGAPPVLLVAGLGEDLTHWTPGFVAGLVGLGYRVVTMDNRDSGRSTFVTARPPGVLRQLLARPRSDCYDLADLATDCAGLLDRLGVDAAHVVGRSMGGMVAQTLAARARRRVLSLTSIMSTTGARGFGQPALSTMLLLAAPPPTDRTGFVRAHLRMTAHLAGTGYPLDEVAEAEVAVRTWDRAAGDLAAGSARQIQAIQASGDRSAELRSVTAPTLVLHGDRDRIVAPSGAAATAAAIPQARHVVVPGMGHHLPDALAGVLLTHVGDHLAAVDRTTQDRTTQDRTTQDRTTQDRTTQKQSIQKPDHLEGRLP